MSRRRMMMGTIQAAAAPYIVFWRPTSTTSAFAGTAQATVPSGKESIVHTLVNEETPNDSTDYTVTFSPTTNFTVKITGNALPATITDIRIRGRVKRNSSGTGGRMRVYLNNTLYLDQNGGLSQSWQTFEASIDPSEMSAWNMSDLRLKCTMSGFTNGQNGLFTWTEVQFTGHN